MGMGSEPAPILLGWTARRHRMCQYWGRNTTVRSIVKQIQLVIVNNGFGTVGSLRNQRLYGGFFKYCHRKYLHQCVE